MTSIEELRPILEVFAADVIDRTTERIVLPQIEPGTVEAVDAVNGRVTVRFAVPNPDGTPAIHETEVLGVSPAAGDDVSILCLPPSGLYCLGAAIPQGSEALGGPVHHADSTYIALTGTGSPVDPLIATLDTTDIALDADVVHLTGNEVIAGTKTFTSAPSVPDASFTEAKVIGLAADLSARLEKALNLSDVASPQAAVKNLHIWIDPTHPSYGMATSDATGSTNSTALNSALVDAAALGIPCFIPEGNFLLKELVTVPTGTHLFGDGPSSILRHNFSGTGAGAEMLLIASLSSDVIIRDLTIDGGSKVVQNATIEKSGGTATVTTTTAHGRSAGQRILITGETADLTFNVVAATIVSVPTTTSYTFALAGTLASTPATGFTHRSPEDATVGANFKMGLYIDQSDRILVERVTFQNTTGDGISYTGNCDDVEVGYCRFSFTNGFAMMKRGTRVGENHRFNFHDNYIERTYFGCSGFGWATSRASTGATSTTGSSGPAVARPTSWTLNAVTAATGDYAAISATPSPLSQGDLTITWTATGDTHVVNAFYSAFTPGTPASFTCYTLSYTKNGITQSLPSPTIPAGATIRGTEWDYGMVDLRIVNNFGYCIDHDFFAGYSGLNQRILIQGNTLDNFDLDTGAYYVPTDAFNHVGSSTNGAGGAGGGFAHPGGNDVVVSNNIVVGSDGRAINISNYPNPTTPRMSRVIVSNNVVRRTALGPGLITRVPRGATSTTVYNTNGQGVLVRNCSDTVISVNKVFETVQAGIYCGVGNIDAFAQSSPYSSITGNEIQSSSQEGIYLENSDYCSVVSNILNDNGGSTRAGIRIAGSRWGVAGDNVVDSSGADGIRFEDGVFDSALSYSWAVRNNTLTRNNGYGVKSFGSTDYLSLANVYGKSTHSAQNVSGDYSLTGTHNDNTGGSGTFTEGSFAIVDAVTGFAVTVTVGSPSITAARSVALPDASGTIPLLSLAQTWTAVQSIQDGRLKLLNATSGGATLQSGGATGNPTISLPAVTAHIAAYDVAQTWTAVQTHGDGMLVLAGSSSGAGTLKAPAAASTYVWTLPAATTTLVGQSDLASGVLTFLGTPSSSNLRAALTDETGSGAAVFADTPTLIAPLLGTPTSGNLANCTAYPVASLSGLGTNVATFLATPSSANLAAALTDETGTGASVFADTPTVLTPKITGSSQMGPTGFTIPTATANAEEHYGIAAVNKVILYRSGGTVGSPSVIAGANLEIGRYSYGGYDGSVPWVEAAYWRAVTSQAYSSTAWGTRLEAHVTTNATVTDVEAFRIANNATPGANVQALFAAIGAIGTAPTYLVHLMGGNAATSALGINVSTTGPTAPASGNAAISIYKATNTYLLITYNDGGTTRYKYMQLNGAGSTWADGTVLPT